MGRKRHKLYPISQSPYPPIILINVIWRLFNEIARD